MPNGFLIRLYSALLYLYPREFRSDFGDEMRTVFVEAVSDVEDYKGSILREVLLGELRDFPLAVLGAHYRERFTRQPDRPIRGLARESSLSAKEMLVALFAFILPVGFILQNTNLSLSLAIVLPAILVFVIITFAVGMYQRFPRWSLPYLGQVVSITGYLFLFQWVADLLSPEIISRLGPAIINESAYPLIQAFSAGFLWLSLFGLTLLILGLLALLPWFRPLYWRIRQDWSLISFILYGEAIVALILLFDGYRYEEPYIIASLMLLGAGAWLYLRSPTLWQRILALCFGLTLAIWVPAVVKWLVASDLTWSLRPHWRSFQITNWIDAGHTILDWGWMVLVLLAPALLGFFPPGEKTKRIV
jgi:hypothetical protein